MEDSGGQAQRLSSHLRSGRVSRTAGGQTPINRDGALKAVFDPQGGKTDYTYDNQGRVSLSQDPSPAPGQSRPETHFSYEVDGQLDTVTDPLNRVTSYDYDRAGRINKITSPDPDGTGSALPASVSYTYDSVTNLLKETDARGYSTQFAYDQLYRGVAATDALANTTSFTYDKVGNLKSLTDPGRAGVKLGFFVFAAHRVRS